MSTDAGNTPLYARTHTRTHTLSLAGAGAGAGALEEAQLHVWLVSRKQKTEELNSMDINAP